MSTPPPPLTFWEDFDEPAVIHSEATAPIQAPAHGEHATASASDPVHATPAPIQTNAAQPHALLPVIGPILVTPIGRNVCEPITSLNVMTPKDIKSAYREAYLNLAKQRILAQGLPEHLWPSDADVESEWVLEVAATGKIPHELKYTSLKSGPVLLIDKTTSRGPAHPRVEKDCDTELEYRPYASYIFTDGEVWWDGAAQWLANDMQTVLDAYKYLYCVRRKTTPELRDEIIQHGKLKKLGRPPVERKEDPEQEKKRTLRKKARIEKENKRRASAQSHWEWVAACRKYNASVELARQAYKEEKRNCLEELEAVRVKYESSLVELENQLANLLSKGPPPRSI